ncbi:hypothetical protein G1L02_12505 [Tenacibaculum finnmarkense]|uniref:hypothetical protein n=1 Tax=Tenacibaculum finnmarkense TaxID=2781243 RepID=UPI001EFA7483|nr:hypothetical protein [Tenacibaculum finnmarkense]MCG8883973.1 hypothetical protein [Tenacibaculum finnmarkense]
MMKTKNKIRLVLELMLENADSQGYLSMPMGYFIKMVRVTDKVSKRFRPYYEGKGRQRKKILFKEVTDEMVDDIYSQSTPVNNSADKANMRFIDDLYIANTLNRFNDMEEMLKNQRDLIIGLNKELIEIKNRVFWTSDVIEKMEEYFEL